MNYNNNASSSIWGWTGIFGLEGDKRVEGREQLNKKRGGGVCIKVCVCVCAQWILNKDTLKGKHTPAVLICSVSVFCCHALLSHPRFSLPPLICPYSTHPAPSPLSHFFIFSLALHLHLRHFNFHFTLRAPPFASLFFFIETRWIDCLPSERDESRRRLASSAVQSAGVAGDCVYRTWLHLTCCILKILRFCWFLSLCNCSPFSFSCKHDSAVSL